MAFTRQGEGKAYILDGKTDTLRLVEGSEGAQSLAWSPDSRWLAVLERTNDEEQLVVAAAASGQGSVVTGLTVSDLEWSPEGNVLAIGVSPVDFINAKEGSIWLVEGPAQPVARPLLTLDRPVREVAWAPDGKTVLMMEGGGRQLWDAGAGGAGCRPRTDVDGGRDG